jgi:hypothetical protein
MNIRETVQQFKNCSPLSGTEDAWQWSPAPGLNFSGVLSADGERLRQIGHRRQPGHEDVRRGQEQQREDRDERVEGEHRGQVVALVLEVLVDHRQRDPEYGEFPWYY